MHVMYRHGMIYIYIYNNNIDCIHTKVTGIMGVSKNRGTPKWMVYNGKPY